MNKKLKIILVSVSLLIVTIIGFITFGLFLMEEEDRYGDLVYFKDKVKDGDIIFRTSTSKQMQLDTEFNEFGIIEKSWNKVYVWDNQNTIKQSLYDWAEKSKNRNVKVFRFKNSDVNNLHVFKENYNQILNSNKLEFITEN